MSPIHATAAAVFLAAGMHAAPARADLYTSEVDGVIHITSKKPKRGRVLFRIKDDAKPKAAARRSRARPQGDLLPTPAELAPLVRRASAHYSLPEPLIWAVMKVESGFNPNAISHKGAQGLMQLMPFTAEEMGVSDPFDAEQNIFGGSRYLRILANRFDGDLVLTLSGYHAGGGAVNSAGGIPYDQTAEYVRRVLNAYYRYQKQPPAGVAP